MQDFQTHGELRTLGSIRSSANAYKAVDKNKIKNPNVPVDLPDDEKVNLPLVELPDDAKVIGILVPMELHLLSGNTNRIYNNLKNTLSLEIPLYWQTNGTKV